MYPVRPPPELLAFPEEDAPLLDVPVEATEDAAELAVEELDVLDAGDEEHEIRYNNVLNKSAKTTRNFVF